MREALASGEDVNSRDGEKTTALMWAVTEGHESIVRLLIEQPAIDLNCADALGNTALMYAVKAERMSILRLWLQQPRIDANHHGFIGAANGGSALHGACQSQCQPGHR